MTATPAKGASERELPLLYGVLLGLVIERPSYGLELYRRCQRIYGGVLPISGASHVYGGLDSLEKRNLVEVMPGSRVTRQPKPHYRATPNGVRRYQDWLVAQVDNDWRRQELWVRQLGVFSRDGAMAGGLVRRFEEQHLKRVASTVRARDAPSNSRAELIEDLVAEQHRLADGAMLSWFHYATNRIKASARRFQVNGPPGT